MSTDHFDALILTGRPASGKSEIIDALSSMPYEERLSRFHLGPLTVLDDFPMLWTWFEEDRILGEVLGQPRLHSDENDDFRYPYLWDVLVERLGLEYHKRLRDEPDFHKQNTMLVEFSRGTEHGGYAQALPHLPDDLLLCSGIVYVQVSFAESLRKNRRRFNPDRPDSILEHGLTDEKMERLYAADDWALLSQGKESGFLSIREVPVPFATFPNEDDVTTDQPDQLLARLEDVLGKLWALYQG